MLGRVLRKLLLLALILGNQLGFSQEITVKGGFVEDTLKIGVPIHYYLTATYPEKFEIIFPDSTYTFGNFEDVSKGFYTSRLDSARIKDSTIYELVSFEIDEWQKLELPVFLLTTNDSVKIFADTDSIQLEQLVAQVTDTTSLKSNLAYNEVDTEFNLTLVNILLFTIIGSIILLLVIFGKRIGIYFKLKRLKTDYERFSNSFDSILNKLKSENSHKTAETGITLWKKYLEKLDKKPYTKLTTKELLARLENNSLSDNLKNIDKSVYGEIILENIHRDFESLEEYISDRYNEKVKEVKNG